MMKEVQRRGHPEQAKRYFSCSLTALLLIEGFGLFQVYPALGLETLLCTSDIFHLLINNS